MKRHPALIGLSRDHHRTLALCTRILRNPAANHAADIEHHREDLLRHFSQEEADFAPYWAKLPDSTLKERFDTDHAALRAMLSAPQFHSEDWNTGFATLLRDHARFEERILFEAITRCCLSENP